MSADVPIVPIALPGSESDAEIAATLDYSDEAAIEIAGTLADLHRQTIENYRRHLRRSNANRRAENEAILHASARIQRVKRGWSSLSNRELVAGNRQARERARKARNKSEQRARAKAAARP